MNHKKMLDKAKIGIMLKRSIFLSTVAFSLKHVFDDTFPYLAGTDGRSIIYNTQQFIDLTPNQRIALVAHEAWHVALMHMLRQGDKDKNIYNRAGDYVINQLLFDDGFELPPGGCQNNKFRGMSTNQVYELIKDDSDENPNETNKDIVFIAGSNNKDGEGNSPPPGMSKETTAELEAHINGVLIKANIQSKLDGENPGKIPGEISRSLEELIDPKLPWEMMLQRFLTERVKNDYSWKRPNKRFMPDYFLPTQYSEALTHITIAIDTSGSIGDEDLKAILSEIQYIRDTFKPQKMTILDCDHKIHNIHEVEESTHILDLEFNGGGGTSCYPVFNYVDKHPTAALIYFTDLYLDPYRKDVDYPVLWIVYDNPNAQVHVGEITHYEI